MEETRNGAEKNHLPSTPQTQGTNTKNETYRQDRVAAIVQGHTAHPTSNPSYPSSPRRHASPSAYKWPSIEGAEARRELGEGGGQLRPRVWSVSPRSSCQGRCCQGDEPYDSVARSRRLGVLLRWLGLGLGLACGG